MDKSKSPHLQTPGEREEFLNNSLLLPPTLTDIFNISFAMIPVLHNIVIKILNLYKILVIQHCSLIQFRFIDYKAGSGNKDNY